MHPQMYLNGWTATAQGHTHKPKKKQKQTHAKQLLQEEKFQSGNCCCVSFSLSTSLTCYQMVNFFFLPQTQQQQTYDNKNGKHTA